MGKKRTVEQSLGEYFRIGGILMYKLKKLNVTKIVNTEYERDKYLEQGYVLVEESKPKSNKKSE